MPRTRTHRIIVLDANAIIHRAFHALPPLMSPSGEPTSAVYGFVSILLKIINELKPDYLAAAFDVAAPTFRHAAYERYKATRVKAPDELYAQFPRVKEILGLLNIPIYEKEGYEADDIIGTAAAQWSRTRGAEVIIVTGDLDTLQLVSPRVRVYTMRKGISDTVMYDEAGVKARFGFPPRYVADYKGLRGDPSDNIPGVRGIGEKTATDLITTFGSLERIYKHIRDVAPEGVRKKLEAGKEEAFFSKELATINTRVPLTLALSDARWRGDMKDNRRLRQLFETLGFFSLLKRLGGSPAAGNAAASEEPPRGDARALVSAAALRVSEAGDAHRVVGEIKKRGSVSLACVPREGMLRGTAGWELWGSVPGGSIFSLSDGGPLDAFREVCEDPMVEKITYDGKACAGALRAHGIFLKGIVFDVVLAHYVRASHEKQKTLPEYAADARGVTAVSFEDAVRALPDIRAHFFKKISDTKLENVLKTIELPLIPFLVEMEYRGIRCDAGLLKDLSHEAARKLSSLETAIHDYAGEPFNINSPRQVARVLFEKLSLTEKGMRKTKGGAQSTQASELAKLAQKHPIVEAILEYRELQKLKTTYIDVLPTLIRDDGRIHTTFNQTGTVTGRLSSLNPNLQNIPTRTEMGKKIREAFVADPATTFLSCDYSQIELRLAAHMSGDRRMIDAFKRGVDIHAATAAAVMNVSLENVTPELRREAKTLNFGILYGMGARAFAEGAGVSLQEAKQFIAKYFEDFSGLRAFQESLKEHARRHGYVETLFGRRRYLPELASPYVRVRMDAERMAINMPIQGTDADIMKLAMNAIWKDVLEEGRVNDIRPLLQIHDELLFEVKKGSEERYRKRICGIMEGIVRLSVPVVVDSAIGSTWGDV